MRNILNRMVKYALFNICPWSSLIKVNLVRCSAIVLRLVPVNGRRLICLPAGVLTLKSVKCMKQRFSECKRMYLTPLTNECLYGSQRWVNAIDGRHQCCWKTSEKLWWVVNVHYSDVGRYNPQKIWSVDTLCFVGSHFIWTVLGDLRKWVSSSNGPQTQSKTITHENLYTKIALLS
jgi:hypothetical protein